MSGNDKKLNLGQIRWKCRRGMLELDLILLAFFDKHFVALSEVQQCVFIELLDEQDPDLYRWFLTAERPPQEHLAEMINYVKQRFLH